MQVLFILGYSFSYILYILHMDFKFFVSLLSEFV